MQHHPATGPDLCFSARLEGAPALGAQQRHTVQVAFVRALQQQIGDDRDIVKAYTAWEQDRTAPAAATWSAVHARAARSALAGVDAAGASFSLEWISDVD